MTVTYTTLESPSTFFSNALPGKAHGTEILPIASFYAVLREEKRKGKEACVLNPLRHFMLYQAKIVL